MPRTRAVTSASSRRSPRGTGDGMSLLTTAERMVGQIEALVDEMAALRSDNEALRRELQDAVAMMERASSALGSGGGGRRRAASDGNGGRRAARTAVGRRAKVVKGRATPPEVTADVVRAVLAKLGEATAAEVAQEITKAGVPVSGRAVRFIAERAGAQTSVGPDGQRRYRL